MLKKALCVGIDAYSNGNELSGAVNDANKVANVLRRHTDDSPNYSVLLKADVDSKDRLTGLIKELFSGNADSAVLFFSGHGYVDSEGMASLVTPDMTENIPGVSMNDILMWANKSEIRNKIIILDCCFSGNMGSFSGDGTKANLEDGVTILTASRSNQPSMEYMGAGIFTSLLVEALEGGASDLLGNVTPGSVYAYIDKALGPWEQRPVFKSNVSTFDILRRVKAPIDINILRDLPNIFSVENTYIKLDPSYEETNSCEIIHEVREPYANDENVVTFKKLQKLTSNGLVEPVGEDHMYFAAMNNKECRLTALGKYYLNLSLSGKL